MRDGIEIQYFNTGRRIKKLMDEMSISSYEFARLLGKTQSAVNAWTQGRNDPTIRSLQEVCCVFGVSLSDFFSEDLQVKTNPDYHTILTLESILTEQDKKLWIAVGHEIHKNRQEE